MPTIAARPGWFTPVAGLLVLWGLMGCAACFMQVVLGQVPGAAAEDLALVRGYPIWFNLVYTVATIGALAGAAALVARSKLAVPLFAVSLVAVLIQFGYVFVATDTLARKGAGAAGFPVFVAVIGGIELWLALHAHRRGWIG